MGLYYIVKNCEWCGKLFEQRGSNVVGRRTCSEKCRHDMKETTIKNNSVRVNVKGKLRMSLKPILDDVMNFRNSNNDVFSLPTLDQSFNYTHEEISELYRVAQRMLNDHLRGNDLDMDIDNKKHLEWGQALMMLMTIAYQMDIDPDHAIVLMLQVMNERCANKRQELINHD